MSVGAKFLELESFDVNNQPAAAAALQGHTQLSQHLRKQRYHNLITPKAPNNFEVFFFYTWWTTLSLTWSLDPHHKALMSHGETTVPDGEDKPHSRPEGAFG